MLSSKLITYSIRGVVLLPAKSKMHAKLIIQGCYVTRNTDGKSDKTFFQVNRFIQQNGEWFYMTREGEERGPFDSRDDAEGDMILYIRHQVNMQGFGH